MNTVVYHLNHFIIMNKSLLSIATLVLIITLVVSCTAQDDNGGNTIIKSEKYEPCCGTPDDVNKEIATGLRIFIPNVFTPNEDGINDLFYPIVDTSLIKNGAVWNFAIYNSNDVMKRRIIFARDFVNYNEIKSYGFDGKYFNEAKSDWAVWEGQFWYSFSVNIEGKGQFNFNGVACSIVCDDEAAIFRDKQGCFFPAQVSKDIQGDKQLSNLEKDCFK